MNRLYCFTQQASKHLNFSLKSGDLIKLLHALPPRAVLQEPSPGPPMTQKTLVHLQLQLQPRPWPLLLVLLVAMGMILQGGIASPGSPTPTSQIRAGLTADQAPS